MFHCTIASKICFAPYCFFFFCILFLFKLSPSFSRRTSIPSSPSIPLEASDSSPGANSKSIFKQLTMRCEMPHHVTSYGCPGFHGKEKSIWSNLSLSLAAAASFSFFLASSASACYLSFLPSPASSPSFFFFFFFSPPLWSTTSPGFRRPFSPPLWSTTSPGPATAPNSGANSDRSRISWHQFIQIFAPYWITFLSSAARNHRCHTVSLSQASISAVGSPVFCICARTYVRLLPSFSSMCVASIYVWRSCSSGFSRISFLLSLFLL